MRALTSAEIEHARVRLGDMARRSTATSVALAIGVSEQNLRNFLEGRVKVPRGETLSQITAWWLRAAPIDEPTTVPPPPPAASSVAEPPAVYEVADPVMEMVRLGQAEQAAWVLEFAARLLEAGAQRLRQGVKDAAVDEEAIRDSVRRSAAAQRQAKEA